MKNKITKRGKMNAYKVEIKIVNKNNKKLEDSPAIREKRRCRERNPTQVCEFIL